MTGGDITRNEDVLHCGHSADETRATGGSFAYGQRHDFRQGEHIDRDMPIGRCPGNGEQPPAVQAERAVAPSGVPSAEKSITPPEYSALEEAARERQVHRSENDSSDTEADEGASPAGSGPRGLGEPMIVGRAERARFITDGAGLCSPGRWGPRKRPIQKSHRLLSIRAALRRAVLKLDQDGKWADELFRRLCTGSVHECPFPEAVVHDLAEYAMALFDGQMACARHRATDLEQAVRVRLLQAILREAGDPDANGMDHFGRGIRVGVGCRLPRTPAVFERKRRWRLDGQSDRSAWERPSVNTVWQDNYRSAKDQAAELEHQLKECHSKGWALRLEHGEAKRRFPNLVVSSLGAVVKTDPDTGEATNVRMVLDGTHRVALNNQIRVRDQDRCPTASDVRR